MKTSLDHLDPDTQEELKDIAEFVKNHPEMEVDIVILFGSYARGDWVSDRYTDESGTRFSYESDIDLLFIMASEKKAQHRVFTRQIKRRINKINDLEKSLSIIYHGVDYFNEQVERCEYFFLDIYKEGILLYDSGKFKLSEPQLISKKLRYSKALESYEKWFKSSNGFFKHYNYAKHDEDFDIAMFNLHQTTERLFTTISLVYTDYKPKIHDLKKLYGRVLRHENRFSSVFPCETKEEQRLFDFLKDAYIDSRYKRNYNVNVNDMIYLEERVKLLIEMTENFCQEKIEEFKNDID